VNEGFRDNRGLPELVGSSSLPSSPVELAVDVAVGTRVRSVDNVSTFGSDLEEGVCEGVDISSKNGRCGMVEGEMPKETRLRKQPPLIIISSAILQ